MVLTMRFAKLGHTVCSDYQLMVFLLRDIDEHFNPNKNHDAVIVLLRRINDAVYDADDFYTQAERVDDRYKMVKEGKEPKASRLIAIEKDIVAKGVGIP
ncbi:hypothetical protein OWV82_013747 [Melia azedarach]|uniref:Uncharacterized protein n=1 Tax=Melia azedarach TaxID=155640 RepID=A0ACC1XVK2_MELAZ|nr:hypothetical protein OWV82_013747 [Melia azedarach]